MPKIARIYIQSGNRNIAKTIIPSEIFYKVLEQEVLQKIYTDSKIIQAYFLIEKQNYSEAIQLIETRSERNGANGKTQLIQYIKREFDLCLQSKNLHKAEIIIEQAIKFSLELHRQVINSKFLLQGDWEDLSYQNFLFDNLLGDYFQYLNKKQKQNVIK